VRTLALSAYLDSEFGVPQDLIGAGSALENPFVYDAAARELKEMADAGLVTILSERTRVTPEDVLIDQLRFMRVR
jgi:hypothetical protein